jgi:hypothetical protein
MRGCRIEHAAGASHSSNSKSKFESELQPDLEPYVAPKPQPISLAQSYADSVFGPTGKSERHHLRRHIQ